MNEALGRVEVNPDVIKNDCIFDLCQMCKNCTFEFKDMCKNCTIN